MSHVTLSLSSYYYTTKHRCTFIKKYPFVYE